MPFDLGPISHHNSDDVWSDALAPIIRTFSFSQLETVLYAFLPTRIEQHVPKTGIYAVDTFVITASVTLILTVAKLTLLLLTTILTRLKHKRDMELANQGYLTIVVEPAVAQDDYHITSNVYHQALSRLVSQGIQSKATGSYTLKPNFELDHAPTEPPKFDMIPHPGQACTIQHGECTFQIMFQEQRRSPPNITDSKSSSSAAASSSSSPSQPSPIQISMKGCREQGATISVLSTFLERIAHDYITYTEEAKRSQERRSRYNYSASGKWIRICPLHAMQNGLRTVALRSESEVILKKDLDTFVRNKDFYKRIGAPYTRGYLFHGRPGTGKTSLVFAMASALNRDLYFMNLGYVDSDSELFQAFATVPPNSIIVFEDVDTMTDVLHRRKASAQVSDTSMDRNPRFNLSTFLSILDGHVLEEGIIFIMTTNYPEVLDPAVIRPGRMDIHLDLSYSTHYQIRRMYGIVHQDCDRNSSLDDVYPDLEREIPEYLIPPSEIMQIMVACRESTDDIPTKLRELVQRYKLIDA
ncbi:mitochondrial chaperone bcs1-b [Lichtheimia corymbifera JMRC:FSU:9682]|uniref:Mitochondrial chaperone bcs1-b n=1 Tax=Lichtheimia corymbifera JMRC:FSU:9682 TaxID=1263082 RepID=A0A068RTX5_9FUNG|nr:mitochondrial chaperone bcs1-b [Lichtheimia corymbifera JMRC:FSU:9682]